MMGLVEARLSVLRLVDSDEPFCLRKLLARLGRGPYGENCVLGICVPFGREGGDTDRETGMPDVGACGRVRWSPVANGGRMLGLRNRNQHHKVSLTVSYVRRTQSRKEC